MSAQEVRPINRLYRMLISPREAMRDIAARPELTGPIIVMFLYVIASFVFFLLLLEKFVITGPYAETVMRGVRRATAMSFLAIAYALPFRWAVKSLLVWKLCDQGSNWRPVKALAVTGYSYVAELVVGIASYVLVLALMPTIYIDTSNLAEARRLFEETYMPLVRTIKLCTLPLTFGGVIWKSYLGALGAYFGTEERCSLWMAFAVFFLLGLIIPLINLMP